MFHKEMYKLEVDLDAFKWLDVVNPSKAVLEKIASELGLPKKVVMNCLDPDYLPHVETYGSTQFVLLRLMEPKVLFDADSVQELTTKVALFMNASKVISIHRLPLPEINEIEKKIKLVSPTEVTKYHLISLFFEQVSLGFDVPLNDLEHKIEAFEEKVFKGEESKLFLQDGYYIKRKASAFKKVMKFTIDTLNKLMQKSDCPLALMQEVRDRFDRNLFYADDIYENVQSLLNLHIAMASQRTNEASFRTNEIVRVLTVLTIFFLPLNFLAGVYGMNFEHIPLLKDEHGFWYAIVFMIATSAGLASYVLKKGWLSAPPKN
ncbi:MAG: magnesium and cobalt transport protein [Bdellovibrio sp.]|nr:magnesium and cobalt transport protein [Bdellovibrio sp.]